MRAQTRPLLIACALSLLTAYACSTGSESAGGENEPLSSSGGKAGQSGKGGSGGKGQGQAGQAGAGGKAGQGGGISVDQGDAVSLVVDPGSVSIEVLDGKASPQQLKAKATYKDGSTNEVTVAWSFDRADLGTVDKGGLFTPFTSKGGKGTVTATLGKLNATAPVTVKLRLTQAPAGLSQADKDAFKSPQPGPSGTLLYPYEGTVFARGLLPPEVMWDGAAAGDLYRVVVQDAFVTLESFASADDGRWQPSKAWWDALAFSSEGAPIAVSVQRKPKGGSPLTPMTRTIVVAPGNLRGTIYYWAVNLGQIVKLKPGADAPVPAFDPGPADQLGSPPPVSGYEGQQPPWDNQGGGKRCVACHTVSRDGSTLAALFSACGTAGGGKCYRPWGVVDTGKEAITAMSPYGPGDSIFSALSPDGARLVTDTADFRLRLFDPKSGATIASALDDLNPDGSGPAGANVAHPQFSSDGKLLAFVGNVQGGYPIEFTHSDLQVADVDLGKAPYFSNVRQLVPGGNDEIGFPSFTPDGQWVVYQKGNYSRASYDDDGKPETPLKTGYNDLFLTDVGGSGNEIKLSQANGEGLLPDKESRRNYQPRVNPVAVGGYYWVVFVSTRDYGNKMRSSGDATLENRKQLWVAAVDAKPQPGKDPSHPAFRLGGQALDAINMDGYWALEPCKQNGTSCGDGYECCTGFCRDQGNGTFACVPPPENQCSLLGESCKTAADCCPSTGAKVQCIGGFCSLPGPG